MVQLDSSCTISMTALRAYARSRILTYKGSHTPQWSLSLPMLKLLPCSFSERQDALLDLYVTTHKQADLEPLQSNVIIPKAIAVPQSHRSLSMRWHGLASEQPTGQTKFCHKNGEHKDIVQSSITSVPGNNKITDAIQ